MRLKSYFCATVEAAMEMARKELGEDALLVNARPTTAGTRSLGALEVVFGLPAGIAKTPAFFSPAPLIPDKPARTPTAPLDLLEQRKALGDVANTTPKLARRALGPDLGPDLNMPDLNMPDFNMDEGSGHPVAPANGVARANRVAHGDVVQDMANLRREMERIAQSLGAAASSGLAPDFPPPGQQTELYRRLLDAELPPTMARQVAEGAALEDFVDVNATLGRTDSLLSSNGSRPDLPVVVALVGPPGAGKTTTLIKLAARYGLAGRRSTQIVSADVERIAAADQLRVLAAILGVGCTVVETARSLAQAIEEHRHKDFIFIDTPGFAGNEMEQAAELAAFLAGNPAIDTHLVLAASTRADDLARMADLYGIFRPAKLLFTKMDETRHFGALVSESARCGLPLSFLSMGQTIPDHLQPASKESVAALVMGDETALTRERSLGQKTTPGRQTASGQMGAYEHGRAAPKQRTQAYEPAVRKLAAPDLPQAAELPRADGKEPGWKPQDTPIGNAPAKARAAGAGA